MNIAAFSVRRPVMTTMLALIVVVLGIVAFLRLRIDLLPAIESQTLSVSTNYEGADPEVVERLVTQIIEEIINTVPGVTELSSTSAEGRSRIRVTFAWGTDIDVMASDVRARLEEELSEMPDEIDRPQIRKFDINSFPVVLLGVASDLDPIELTDIVERQVRDRFSRLPGVAQVDLWGGYDRELRIELDPQKMQALQLSSHDVATAIRNANIDLPAGMIEDSRFEITLRAPAEFTSIAEIEELVVEMRDGAAITIGQIATILDTNELLTRLIRVNGRRGIRVAIRKEADANTVEVARAILEEIERTNQSLPQIHVAPVINQGNFIERSIKNVAQSVLYGGSLAIFILLFFLRSLRSTAVIAIAIPLSILATLTLIFGGGLTLNLMTLGGLALGVGMMVDSSIVVLENIFRRRQEQQEPAKSAAIQGTGEVAGAIIASTITTLVIFLPLAFIEGVTGILFGELALVVVYSLIASLIVALTLVPMLSARMLAKSQSDTASAQGQSIIKRLVAAAGETLQSLESVYKSALDKVLHMRWLTIFMSVLLLGLSLLLWPFIGTEFMPPSDEGSVQVNADFEPGMRLDIADRQTRVMEQIIDEAVPEIESVVTSVSASGRRGSATASARIELNLGSSTQRERSNTEIGNDLRKRLTNAIPGLTVRVRAPQGQRLLERVLGNSETGLSIEMRGFQQDILEALSVQVQEAVVKVRGVTDVDSDVQDLIPQEHFTLDRRKISDLGLDTRAVAETLESNIGGLRAGDYRPEGLSIPIRIQYAHAEQLSLDEIYNQTVKNNVGESIALRNVITSEPGFGPAQIVRKDQQRAVTMSVNVENRDLGSAAAEIEQVLQGIPRPLGYSMYVSGSYEEQQKAFVSLSAGFVLALLLVYMVLASQYESFRDPLIVMFSVPVAAIGVLVTLYMTQSTMNVQSGIGCIMLGGIVVNNAILLVDQTGRLRHEGLRTHDAIVEAGRRRLRPILMTTATTILGLLPLALGIGEGADAQAPLARAVVGGLAASTFITLFLIPAIYSVSHTAEALEADDET